MRDCVPSVVMMRAAVMVKRPVFGTKYLYFGQSRPVEASALIPDAFVAPPLM